MLPEFHPFYEENPVNRIARIFAAMFALALIAAACGSDDGEVDTGATATDETAESEDAMEDESDDAMEDESEDAMEDSESEDAMEDDAMEDESEDAMEDSDSGDAMADGDGGLAIVSIDFDAGEVVIANNGGAEVDLDGHFLCNFPSYAPISGIGAVAPGASVTVPIPVDVSPAAGELGLYTTDSYSSPDAIQAYVEWGTADHERSGVAQEAGIWDGVPLTVEDNMLIVG